MIMEQNKRVILKYLAVVKHIQPAENEFSRNLLKQRVNVANPPFSEALYSNSFVQPQALPLFALLHQPSFSALVFPFLLNCLFFMLCML